jgi:hypothetical protein
MNMALAEQPALEPDRAAMLAHLEHLFGSYLDGAQDGLIEIAWTDTMPDDAGKYKLGHAKLFGTDELEKAVDQAVKVNSVPMCNVYVGGALRKPNATGRGHDTDLYAALCVWCDLDSSDSVQSAKLNYASAKPTFVVKTGNIPHQRIQCWWKLSDRIDDPERLRGLLMGIACQMGGDTTVTNPARLMRLAGGIAWPQKTGRVTEITSIVALKEPGLQEYMPEHLEHVFPPVVSFAAAKERRLKDGGDGSIVRASQLGMPTGKVIDGREKYMVKLILATLIEYVGTNGTEPGTDDLFNAAWPVYRQQVDLSRPGRGEGEFKEKCNYTVRRFVQGQIPGLRTIDEAISVYHKRSAARTAYSPKPQPEPEIDPSKPLILTSAQFVAGFTPPQYLIDGIVQRGYLYSVTARTGHGKTAVGMYLGQAIAFGRNVQGHKVLQGPVLFLAGENPDDIRARFLVLADQHKFDPNDAPMFFIPGVINLADAMPLVRAETERVGGFSLVMVDTAAAYFRGDDANSNAQQGEYGRLLRQLTFLPGLPAVLVNSHPIKHAQKDNLVPAGGGAFLNEVDGNLTLWSGVENQTELHWQGKFRGPEFEPIAFKMETVTCDSVKDAEGRLMPSVVALPISDMEVGLAQKATEASDDVLLRAIATNKPLSQADLARLIGWVTKTGHPQKSKVHRAVERLNRDKLIVRSRGDKYRVTKTGKQALGMVEE